MQMMLCCNMQPNMWTYIHANALVQLMIFYAFFKPGDPPNNWKFALPNSLLQPTNKWFYQVTGHPGRKRLFMQIFSW